MVAAALDGAFADEPGDVLGFPVGCPVLDRDGERLGMLAGADGDVLLMRHALPFEDRVPLALVAGFDGEALRLSASKDEVRHPERGGESHA